MARTGQAAREPVGTAGAGRGGRRRGAPGRLVGLVVLSVASLAFVPAMAGAAGAASPRGHRRAGSEHGAHVHHGARRVLTVSVAKRPKLGTILVGATGRTLYHDALGTAKKPACSGACLKLWPPLWLPKGVALKAGKGVSHLGLIRRSGHRQVTFEGEPLYYYVGDTHRGQANGEGLLRHWYVVHPAGTSTGASTRASSSAGATGNGGGSWG